MIIVDTQMTEEEQLGGSIDLFHFYNIIMLLSYIIVDFYLFL